MTTYQLTAVRYSDEDGASDYNPVLTDEDYSFVLGGYHSVLGRVCELSGLSESTVDGLIGVAIERAAAHDRSPVTFTV